MCWLVNAHWYCRIPRLRSWVTARALDRSCVGATQTFITPSTGARYVSHDPSGLICGDERSGLPKSTLRGIRGVPLAFADGCALTNGASVTHEAKRSHDRQRKNPFPERVTMSPCKRRLFAGIIITISFAQSIHPHCAPSHPAAQRRYSG